MTSVKELLIRAKNKIATEKTWTKGRIAADKFDVGCAAWDARAVCWCAIGALQAEAVAVICNGDLTAAEDALEAAAEELYKTNVAKVNDYKGLDAIHRVYDRAIAEVGE